MVCVTRVYAAHREGNMDTERRIDQLEARLRSLEQERAADQAQLRRDRRMRMVLLVIAGGAYLFYFSRVFSIIDGS